MGIRITVLSARPGWRVRLPPSPGCWVPEPQKRGTMRLSSKDFYSFSAEDRSSGTRGDLYLKSSSGPVSSVMLLVSLHPPTKAQLHVCWAHCQGVSDSCVI